MLFVFWDLTAIASYLLIGFDRQHREARLSALMALLVTGVSAVLLLSLLVPPVLRRGLDAASRAPLTREVGARFEIFTLAAFTLSQMHLLDQRSLVYPILDLVGSAVLVVIAFVDERWASCSWRASGRATTMTPTHR